MYIFAEIRVNWIDFCRGRLQRCAFTESLLLHLRCDGRLECGPTGE